MKKVIFSLLLAAGTFTVSMANINAINYDVKLESNTSNVVKVDFNAPEDVQLTVTDYNGNVLCNYAHVKNSRSFDFGKLPAGNYFIKVENSRYAETSLVSKTDSTVNVKKDYKFVLKPVFKATDDKMDVYVPNPSNSNVEIDVYDKDNYLVYSFTNDDAVINKVLDFSKSPYGKYTINVSSSNDDVNYTSDFERK